LQILFAQTPAQEIPYAYLAPGSVGRYQFNVVVPAVPDGDLVPLTFSLGGVAPAGLSGLGRTPATRSPAPPPGAARGGGA
jgi:uncharacterized protein (TIGR03437 family)